MRKISLLTILCLLSACSKVDSLQPFDQQAAANFLNQGSTTYKTKQRIKLTSLNKAAWQRIDMSYGTVGSPVMLIPNGATRTAWNQSIRTYLYPYQKDPNMTPEKWIEETIQKAKHHCDRISTDHLSVSKTNTTYQLSMYGCGTEKSQIRIGKAFRGEDAIYVVYYTAHMDHVNEKDIQQGAAIIKQAALVNNTTAALSQSSSIRD